MIPPILRDNDKYSDTTFARPPMFDSKFNKYSFQAKGEWGFV
jgi:hypothetical protein